MRRSLVFALIIVLALGPALCAGQSRKGFLYGVDRLVSGGRIGQAGRHTTEPRLLSLPVLGELPKYGETAVSKDYGFVMHLFDNKLYDDIGTLFAQGQYLDSDTLSFLRGRYYYETRHLFDAVDCFERVSRSSRFYQPALFYDVALRAWNGDLTIAQSRIASYTGPYEDLAALQNAGLSLLQRNFEAYESSSQAIGSSNIAVSDAAATLASVAPLMRDFRPRKPLLSAAASAVLPGLGKCFCGRVGEGVASFLTVASLAAVTTENWVKSGPSDWKTILFGSMAAITYIANIYGSYISAGIYNQETLQGYETTVLVNILLPLHSVFR